MNAIDQLKMDHRVVEGLFKEVESTTPSRHEALFKRIHGELTTHAHVEEKIFYPAVKKVADKELKDYVLESIEEHLQMKMFLGHLLGMSSKKENFEAKLKVLIEDTRHHVKEEENEWFPKAEDKLSSEQLDKLGSRMEAEKKRYQSANGIKPEDRAEYEGVLTRLAKTAANAVSAVVGASTGGRKKTTSASNGSKKSGSAGTTRSSKTSATSRSNGRSAAKSSNGDTSSSGTKKASGGTKRSNSSKSSRAAA